MQQPRLADNFLAVCAAVRIRTLLYKGSDGSWKGLQHKLTQVSHQGVQLCLASQSWTARHATTWVGGLLEEMGFGDREDYYTMQAIV